jgi:tetratricopeptide (TPR) repeat protein
MEKFEVNVWQEPVIIPTYPIGKPDQNPMFFEKRIYQGSSGAVYPNPIVEKIFDEKEDRQYNGLFLENEYIKIMILPELGGRIQMAFDKIKNRHFIYYNQVIKPALVGLTGPWISGGIEFNWPQHHRPSTFNPIDFKIEENADGSKTVWVNEIEQMFHTKGMAGFTLHPGKAYIEIKAKLYNRSLLPQTFLWWANPAVKVNDYYQSVFPPDVNAVFDHGKRDVSTFPIAIGTYYKVDYSPGTDISWYKNIPVPTSYMAINSAYDFVGGYEHDTQGGLLHIANHQVSPGKKQWTWGHSDFGQAWDRNLTDEDGPYIELMTGMFTDNQPDFTWLLPDEEKSFTQYFLPYKELGIVKNATKDILLTLTKIEDNVNIKIYGTSIQPGLKIELSHKGKLMFEDLTTLDPTVVYERNIAVAAWVNEADLVLSIKGKNGNTLISYDPSLNTKHEIPQPASPALAPSEIKNNEQLFLTGQHLEQYRHATYHPVPYYEEALSNDPGDFRCNNALGLWYLRRGKFALSENYFKTAIATSTARNPNPYDTEPYYNLGLCLKFLNRADEAYDAFYKATWAKVWQDSGYFAVAQIDLARGNFDLALQHLDLALASNANHSKAHVLKVVALKKLGKLKEAITYGKQALERDPFNLGILFEIAGCYSQQSATKESELALKEMLQLARGEAQNFIAYALDYASAGLFREAIELLNYAVSPELTNPIVYYALAYFNQQLGHEVEVAKYLSSAADADSYLCFPNKLEEINMLQWAMEANLADAKAPYYLGNLFYDKRQYDTAITLWERSVAIDPNFATTWRNLGIAYFNKLKKSDQALAAFEKAFQLNSSDARVLMELDQLYKRLNKTPQQRLEFLTKHKDVAFSRDDVYLEYLTILNFLGAHKEALALLTDRKFHPWEGGEGKASGQYVYSLVQLAKQAIQANEFEKSIAYLQQAQTYPHNLGEGKLFGAQENDIFYWLGCAHLGLNDAALADANFQKATKGSTTLAVAMFYNDQQPDKIFYQGLAWRKLKNGEKANQIFENLIAYGASHLHDEVKVDYFAVSLPNLLIFDDDLNVRNQAHCYFMKGLGHLGLEQNTAAVEALESVLKLDPEHQGAKSALESLIDS